jgi:hypothetical protein
VTRPYSQSYGACQVLIGWVLIGWAAIISVLSRVFCLAEQVLQKGRCLVGKKRVTGNDEDDRSKSVLA